MKLKHIYFFARLLFVLAIAFSCQQALEETAINSLRVQEKEEGFVLLFDGETTTGWRSYNGDAFPGHGWIVEDGSLRCIGSGAGEAGGQGGDIVYDKTFKDFHLKIDWKISVGGNSGIFYLGREIEGRPIWHTAPEFQVIDNDLHPGAARGVDGNRKSASLYSILPAVPQNTRPAGEWNQAEIIVYRGSVFHRQNGQDVLEYHLGTPQWNELVKETKFDPDIFGKYIEGVIGPQDHGDDV